MSARTREPRARASGLALACMLVLLSGCGDTTQTVGLLGPEGSLANGSAAGELPRGSSASAPRQGSASGAGQSRTVGSAPSTSADGGVAGAASIAPPPECTGSASPAMRRELDLYLLVDDLISIPPNTWANLVHGLKRYVSDPRAEGTGVGVGFLGLACIADLYSTPSVAIAMLPDNTTAISNAVDGALPINLSPLQAAIQGALTYTRSFSSAHPDRQLALVLITDSIADAVACGDASSLSSAARDGVTGAPSISTYVLAIVDPNTLSLALSLPAFLANPALAGSPLGPLNQIAAAGNTGQAFPYSPLQEPNDSTQASPFADAMTKIQRQAEPCDYAVPDAVPDDGAGFWLLSSASADPLPALAAQADCGTGYSLTTTADGKRWARLCAATCTDVKAANASLSWVSGCP